MLAIILLFALGFLGIAGCFYGATHHAMTAAVCIIIASAFLRDYIEDAKQRRSH